MFERELGRGGMATVYLARELKHDRLVALKVLLPEFAATVGPERFLREIRLTAQLQHPHIVTLIDSGEAGGFLYYAMQFIEGESLRQRLDREGQLPLEDALRIVTTLCETLGYAHALGIVHRDIKPENILLQRGEPMVADFGIGRAVSGDVGVWGGERITETGLAVGSVGYMSPEQATGGHRIDERTDQYSLACVCYEMLVGEPPFTGPTAQAVLARQLQEPPPSLRVVRPSVTPELQEVVERALAKVPADRFGTTAEFAAALTAAQAAGAGASGSGRMAVAGRRTFTRMGVALALAVAAGVAIWRFFAAGPVADPNKVVVYPLSSPGVGPDAGSGEQVALMIGSALEHTEPLTWLDGQSLLGAGGADARLLGSAAARAARRAGARYYVDGAVVRDRDSLTVIVRLHDAVASTLVRQESATGAGALTTAPQLALRAIGLILPRLLPPNGRIDLSYLADRNAAAIADWLQGEREYAHSQYIAAMDHMDRALARDSAMGVAALKGAQAAAHLEDYASAQRLIQIALHFDRQLPRRHLALAHGLQHYLAGAADSALAEFHAAQLADTTWSEPWMWLGETYYHLMPSSNGNLDSLAERSFAEAVRLTPAFAPALFHLGEFAARRGERQRARELLAAFRAVSPDSDWTFQLELTVRCAMEGADNIDWPAAVRRASDRVLYVARILGAGARYPACSRRALETVLARDTSRTSEHVTTRWSALKGLDYQRMAEGRFDQVVALLDSAIARGEPAAAALDLPDVIAGARVVEPRAQATMASLTEPFRRMGTQRLWYFAAWEYYRGDNARLDSVAQASRGLADRSGAGLDRLVAEGAAARLALSKGDTATAIATLRRLRPASDVGSLTWGLWEPAAAERLLLAQLLFATGDPAGAIDLAEAFDSPRAQIHLLYLPASLQVRMQAAGQLGLTARRDGYRARLAALGRSDLH